MSRSPVLSGLISQRDRAQQRGKRDRRGVPDSESPVDQIHAWLDENIAIEDASEAETLDLTAFLRATSQIDLPPEERLRRLAINLESEMYWQSLRGWKALERVYQEAIRLNPKEPWVHHSRAISAKEFAELCSPDKEAETMRRMYDVSWSSAHEAKSLGPEDPDVLYLLGSICYSDPKEDAAEALEYFDRAISFDGKHQWSLLYRAHCLHDLERWSEAYAAYSQISPAWLVGPKAWRYELLLEQKAYCLMKSGNTEEAAEQFSKLIDRWSAHPEFAEDLLGNYIVEAAKGTLRGSLLEKLSVLVTREKWDWFQ